MQETIFTEQEIKEIFDKARGLRYEEFKALQAQDGTLRYDERARGLILTRFIAELATQQMMAKYWEVIQANTNCAQVIAQQMDEIRSLKLQGEKQVPAFRIIGLNDPDAD